MRTKSLIFLGCLSLFLLAVVSVQAVALTNLNSSVSSYRIQIENLGISLQDVNAKLLNKAQAYSKQNALLKDVTEKASLLNQIPGMTTNLSNLTKDVVDNIVDEQSVIVAADRLRKLMEEEIDKMPIQSPFAKSSGIEYTAHFGETVLEGHLRKHNGVDIIPQRGVMQEPIHATRGGQVIEIGHDAVYGKFLVIDHKNGYFTKYAHLSKIFYSADLYKTVTEGQVIGLMGNTGYTVGRTGYHLHYEVQRYDEFTGEKEYLDPEALIEYGRQKS